METKKAVLRKLNALTFVTCQFNVNYLELSGILVLSTVKILVNRFRLLSAELDQKSEMTEI